MEKEYLDQIILAAVSKLNDAKKPLSELEITTGIVHRLKDKYSDDKRHTSKVRFRKESFKEVIQTKEWKQQMTQLENNKIILKSDESKYACKDTSEVWNRNDINYDEAIQFKLSILKKINAYKLEVLVSRLLAKIYPDYSFKVTKKIG